VSHAARRVRATALLSAVAVVVACRPPSSARQEAQAGSAGRPYVVVVSLDAFRYDYIARYHPASLEGLAARGIAARALIPPFPSKTFPSHYTLATGLYPGHHGILSNTFYDPAFGKWFRLKDTAAVRDGRWYGGTPIWVAAQREGVQTSVYFWPGSEAAVQGTRPTAWWNYLASIPDSVRVDAGLAQLRRSPAARPHLVMLYLTDVDDTTHKYGPDTPHTANAVASVDLALTRLLEGVARLPIRDSVNVVVVSDHGMAASPQERMLALRPMLAAAGIDTTRVLMGDNGPVMPLWFAGDTALARRALGVLAAGLTHARAYTSVTAPKRWHIDGNARAGDVFVVADPGYSVAKGERDRVIDRGTHGWDPVDSLMRGIFVAAGPGISAAGTVPAFESVHVYPFLASLLHLSHAPRSDGDPAVLAPYLRAER
jgi:predicted AlkP superfamily pyrophosphatase or phosphodiesterase